MTLNELRDEIYKNACEHGFHDVVYKDGVIVSKLSNTVQEEFKQDDLCRKLMLVVSELVEAMEAERKGQTTKKFILHEDADAVGSLGLFESHYKGTIEEEITDAIIRLIDIAGMLDMDLDWWVKAKMAYNKSRPVRHGKLY